jgi:hypothetical protein
MGLAIDSQNKSEEKTVQRERTAECSAQILPNVCLPVYACGTSDEVTGVFRIAVAAMTLTLLMCALRAACRTSAARGKSSPSALSARIHKSLIISSEFMAFANTMPEDTVA